MNKKYKYYYVYRITNIKNSMHYYGYRSSTIEPIKDLGIKYFSSSKDKEFIRDQKENSHNYKYVIVREFDNREDAHSFEIFLHEKFNVSKNPKFYNRSKSTSTKFSITGTKLSEETKKKMSESRKGRVLTDETKLKISESHKGMVYDNSFKERCRSNMMGNKNMLGKKHSDETKLKLSNSLKDREVWNKGLTDCYSEETKKKMSDAKKNMTEEQKKKMHSWKKGRKLSDEVKLKLSKPQRKVECPHCGMICGISAMKQSHFDKCKVKG